MAAGHWEERHRKGKKSFFLTGEFKWNMNPPTDSWGGVFTQLDAQGNEKRFNWNGKKIPLDEEQHSDVDRRCSDVFNNSGIPDQCGFM